MGSLGTGEILVIVLVAIIVFGPHRLPEISRKAGELLAKARQMANSVTESIDSEYSDIAAPLKDLKGEYDATVSDVKKVASSAAANLSVEMPTVDLKKQDRADQADASATADDDASAPTGSKPAASDGDPIPQPAEAQPAVDDVDPQTELPEDRVS